MRWVVLLVAAAGIGLPAGAIAQTGGAETGPVFRVDFNNPGIAPSHWTLTLHPDGSGHFRSERGSAPAADPQSLETPDVDRDVQVSEKFARRVFQDAHEHSLLAGTCESHMKVAFQGWKKITYTGPEGEWSCEFNYSRDKEIQDLGESLMGVAGTVLEGVRLEMLLQHDRLGLDKELEFIAEASGDGRLMQVRAIRSILERLSDDQDVMERVRKRAKMLLAKADKTDPQ